MAYWAEHSHNNGSTFNMCMSCWSQDCLFFLSLFISYPSWLFVRKLLGPRFQGLVKFNFFFFFFFFLEVRGDWKCLAKLPGCSYMILPVATRHCLATEDWLASDDTEYTTGGREGVIAGGINSRHWILEFNSGFRICFVFIKCHKDIFSSLHGDH